MFFMTTNNVKKMTKKEAFNVVLEVLGNNEFNQKEEVVNIIKNEIDLLTKKATAKSQKDLDKAKKDNELATILYDILVEEGIAKTATELLSTRIKDVVPNINVQKVTHLLTSLLADEKVKKEVIKRKSYYSAI